MREFQESLKDLSASKHVSRSHICCGSTFVIITWLGYLDNDFILYPNSYVESRSKKKAP